MHKQKKLTIVLTGSGSGGPVAPLLALVPHLEKEFNHASFLFVGANGGTVEQHMAKKAGIPFVGIVAAKLRRYWSVSNIATPVRFLIGLVQAYRILNALQPLCVIGAGGFVQVPVCYAAWILGIPVFVHQQDVMPGLANKLCAPVARRITVTFKESVTDFPHGWSVRNLHTVDKVVWTGNPVRELELPAREKTLKHFKLDPDYPTVLIMGGGTGALSLNALVAESLDMLTKSFNVLHITGKGKKVLDAKKERYTALEFIDDMASCYAVADLVLCRAGLSTITELASLKKAAILVPLPGTHQELNALYLSEEQAAMTLDQDLLTPDNLATFLRTTLFDHALLKGLGKRLHELMPQGAGESVVKVIVDSLK